MANFNEQIRWTSGTPPIYVTVTYGKYRSGADMVYSVGLSISSVTGQRYFGYPIYAQIYVNGEGNPRYSTTLKNASPSQWSNTIEYSTGNFTVSNKTTGTTALAVRLYSGSGSSRDETYYFDMSVDPAYFTSTPTLTLKSKTETSITYNWRTSETCDRITWTGSGTKSTTGLPGTSGTVTFSGLTADTSYSHYGTFRRQDSQLETSSTTYTNSTDNYPYVASLSPNIITLGQTALQTINIFNPHSRQTTVYVKKSLNDSDADALATATTTGTSVSITIDASELYPEIPNSQSGTLYYYCKYSSHTTTSITGTYQINGSEKPIFPTSSWSYVADLTALTNNNQIVIDNYSTITLTVNTPATSDYNAGITGYYATWGNATPVSFNGTSSVQLVKGNGTSLVVLANDSRELQSVLSSSTLDMTNNRVLYNKPVINTLETHRLNGIDTTVLLNATGTMFKGTFGANGIQNDIHHIYYYVKAIDSSTWSQAYSISLNDCTFDSTTGEWTISNASIHLNGTSGGFPSGTSYNVKLEFYDAQGLLGYGTATSTIEDGTLARDVFKDSDGEYHEGFNGLADSDYAMKVHGDFDVEGGIYVNGEPFEGGGGDTLPYGAIVDYDGNSVPSGYEEVDDFTYSTNEYYTGKRWIDGKKIYGKVVETNFTSSTGNNITRTLSSLGLNNISTLTLCYSISQGNPKEQDYFVNSGDTLRGFINTANQFILIIGGDYPTKPVKVYTFFEYTKTTD